MTGPSGGRRGRGALEAEILAILAASAAPLTPREVTERLERPLAYTTVMTVLMRLHDKGAVARTRTGRTYSYSFQRDEAAQRAVQMRRLLEGGPDRAKVLTRFLDELSPDDEQLLQQLLREADGG